MSTTRAKRASSGAVEVFATLAFLPSRFRDAATPPSASRSARVFGGRAVVTPWQL